VADESRQPRPLHPLSGLVQFSGGSERECRALVPGPIYGQVLIVRQISLFAQTKFTR
jgi:hypothetical protein